MPMLNANMGQQIGCIWLPRKYLWLPRTPYGCSEAAFECPWGCIWLLTEAPCGRPWTPNGDSEAAFGCPGPAYGRPEAPYGCSEAPYGCPWGSTWLLRGCIWLQRGCILLHRGRLWLPCGRYAAYAASGWARLGSQILRTLPVRGSWFLPGP